MNQKYTQLGKNNKETDMQTGSSALEEKHRLYQVVQVGPGVIDTLERFHDDGTGFIRLVLDKGTALLLNSLQFFLFFL